MCAAPTSGAEPAPPGALLAAGWREADLAWERLQEQAAEHAAAGRSDDAVAHRAEALRLARADFAADDPRLATSLANQAQALRHAGDDAAARALFAEARRVWDASGPWVAALKPERRARSSTFHLRLETKHPGGYERHSEARYRALASEGRAALMALEAAAPAPFDGRARWRAERPAGFTDGRRLLAAVCLLAAAADAGAQAP